MDEQAKTSIAIKPLLSKWVMWLMRSHWLWVFLIIGVQYVSGSVLGGRFTFLASLFSYPIWRQIHMLNSNLIVGVVVLMLLVKGYLWLLRNQRI